LRRALGFSVAACGVALAHSAAWAMGGHFEVDDATVLDPGRCQIELWSLHASTHRLQHAGPSCRLGPAEWGLTLEDQHSAGAHTSNVGMQAKVVAASVAPALDAGLAFSAVRYGHSTLTAVALPATWALNQRVQLHANVGVDRASAQRHWSRLGAAAEVTFDASFALLAERIKSFGTRVSRLGVRWSAGDQTQVDLSGARVSGSGVSVWAVGLTHEFGR
jgi:hypothetical protein